MRDVAQKFGGEEDGKFCLDSEYLTAKYRCRAPGTKRISNAQKS